MKIINRKQIIIIEPDSNNKTRLFIHLKNTIELVNVNDVDKALINANRFLNKMVKEKENYFLLSEFKDTINEKYSPNTEK